MSVKIGPGFGLAAWVMSSSEGTEPFVTTMGVDLSGYGGDYQEAANNAMEAYANSVMPETDSDLTLERCTLTVGADGPLGSIDSNHAAFDGQRSAVGLPWSLSLIARKGTAVLGREGRGRMFIPGVINHSEVGQGGNVSSSRATALATMLNTFLDYLQNGDGVLMSAPVPPVLLHTSATVPTPVTSLTPAPLVGWVRKRIR